MAAARKKNPVKKPPAKKESKRRNANGLSQFWHRNLWFYCGLFALAMLLRLWFLVAIRESPMMTNAIGDGESYDSWAQDIAGGNWIGDRVFYQAPLYPYFLAVIYTVLGRDLVLVRVIQALLGAVSCLFLARAGSVFLGKTAGRVTGLLFAFYPAAIYFDSLLQKTSLGFFLFSGLIFAVARLSQKPTAAGWLVTGLVCGLLGLTRENAFVVVPVVLAWLVIYFRHRARGQMVTWGALFLAGMFSVLLMVAVRNYAVGGTFLLTTSQFGSNLYIGNNPKANGQYAPLRFGRGDWKFERNDAMELAQEALGRTLSPAEVSSYWTDKTLAYIREQPTHWLGLMAHKSWMVWNRVEVADTEDIYTYGSMSLLMGCLLFLFHFGVLAPLAVWGLVVTWHRRRDLWVLYLMGGAYAASVALFFVFDRYRFPVVGVLVILAAGGLAEIKPFWKQASRKALIGAGLLVFSVALIANYPLLSKQTFMANTRLNMGQVLANEGSYEQAVGHFQASLDLDPDRVQARISMGNALINLGRLGEAETQFRRAMALKADHPEVAAQMGLLMLVKGKKDTAVSHFRRSLLLDRQQPNVMNNLAWILATSDNPAQRNGAEAVRLSVRANELTGNTNPGFSDTLAAAYAEAGSFDKAVATAQKAMEMARSAGDAKKADAIAERLKGYREGRPHRAP